MFKKAWCTCKDVILLIRPSDIFTFLVTVAVGHYMFFDKCSVLPFLY